MKTIESYLDDMKRKFGSDYKTAKLLGVSTAAVCMMRSKGRISDENAIKMAKHLEIDPSEILLASAFARSDESSKEYWEKLSKRAGIAAGILLAIGLIGYEEEANANTNQLPVIYIMRSHMYGMCAIHFLNHE